MFDLLRQTKEPAGSHVRCGDKVCTECTTDRWLRTPKDLDDEETNYPHEAQAKRDQDLNRIPSETQSGPSQRQHDGGRTSHDDEVSAVRSQISATKTRI